MKIVYRPEREPQVFVLSPQIEAHQDIHLYSNGSLCLYYPVESPWKHTDNLHEKIIPWTSEWLLFYEIYLLEGKWLGKSVAHVQP